MVSYFLTMHEKVSLSTSLYDFSLNLFQLAFEGVEKVFCILEVGIEP
jgi:hypothetical protein